MIFLLSFILMILFIIVGRMRGFKTFCLFYLSIFLIIVYLFLMSLGLDAIINALLICIVVSLITIFSLNGYSTKTKAVFISVMIVLFIIFILTFFIGKNANIQGFSVESLESIGGYSFDLNYNMTNLFIGMYLVCTIGTVIDTSISVASALNEVKENNNHLNQKDLYKSGMNIGKDILSTTINTLFFATLSGFIGFFMWHYNTSFGYIINYKSFTQEIFKLLICFIGSIMVIPITAYITSIFLSKSDN